VVLFLLIRANTLQLTNNQGYQDEENRSHGKEIAIIQNKKEDYISVTDIAKYKNPDVPADIVKNWLRSKNTIELLGLWERLHNPAFKLVEFEQFRNEAGANHLYYHLKSG